MCKNFRCCGQRIAEGDFGTHATGIILCRSFFLSHEQSSMRCRLTISSVRCTPDTCVSVLEIAGR